MKITKRVEPKAKIKVVSGSNFSVETAEHLPRLHQLCCLFSRKGTFKTTAITNLLKMYQDTGTMDRCIWISSTASSNKKLIEHLHIKPEDLLDPDDPECINKLIQIVEDERDEFLRFQHLVKHYDKAMNDMKIGLPISDEYLVAYYDVSTDQFRKPVPKYKCWLKGRPAIISATFDDVLGHAVLSNRATMRLAQKHRHIGAFDSGGAVGISLYFLVQSFKAVGGLNRSIRNNASTFMIGRTKDAEELKEIASSCAGVVEPEVFYKVYDEATKDSPHDFLFCDLHPKKGQPLFRKNFDTYLFLDGVN